MIDRETLLQLQELEGFDAMRRVILMEGILHTMKVEPQDLEPAGARVGRFEQRCVTLFANFLGEDAASGSDAMALLMACADFETRKSFQGLGGCVAIPLPELIEKSRLDRGLNDADQADAATEKQGFAS